MIASDRFHFSNFCDNHEFGSICDNDALYELEFNEIPDQFWDEMAIDGADEFIGDDV